MQRETLRLYPQTTGCQFEIVVYRFGAGTGPRVYVQAGLHADEIPSLLLATQLIAELAHLEAEGVIRGTITVVPCVNPVALSQRVLGEPQGRFDLASGANFNRRFPDVSNEIGRELLKLDPEDRRSRVGSVLELMIRRQPPSTIFEELQHLLLRLSCDADTILDLHSDHDAELYVYSPARCVDDARLLAWWMGAPLVITTSPSDTDLTFEDACGVRQMKLGPAVLSDERPPFVATVELRGQRDVSDDLSSRDAQALLRFLAHRGALIHAGESFIPRGETPLIIREIDVVPVVAPNPGILLFQTELGAIVNQHDVVAILVDPASQARCELRSPSRGRVYSRTGTRYAVRGVEVVRIARSHQ